MSTITDTKYSRENSVSSTAARGSSGSLPWLLLLFVGSGCAALIYEVVWLQLLQLVIGLTTASLGILLGTYMGGMCLGSLLLPRLVSGRRHPLRVYAVLELGIGACGLAVLYGLPMLADFYTARGGIGTEAAMFRGLVAAICLLPPTLLMGATLPAISRGVESTPRGVAWLGFFYGGNIAGATLGCLVAGFYLLRVYNMATATYVAVAINVAVALLAILVSGYTAHKAPAESRRDARPARTPGAWAVYIAIGLSGVSALGAEVVWTRLVSLMLGATVYTFSIILAVFLLGLGIGSSIGSVLARSVRRPRLALGVCQMLLVFAAGWTVYMITQSLPYWPINLSLSGPKYAFQLDLARCLWTVLPPTILWGASFPLALAALAAKGADPGRLVGGTYAANTVGAILGSLVFSLILVPYIGTQWSNRILVALPAIGALLLLAPLALGTRAGEASDGEPAGDGLRFTTAAGIVAMLALTVLLAWSVVSIPWGVAAFGRQMLTSGNLVPGIVTPAQIPMPGMDYSDTYCIYMGEGLNGTVAVTQLASGVRYFHSAGKCQASSDAQDMRLQRLLGHISALLSKKNEEVLVIACGAGVTAGSFVPYPEVKHITICDIEPLVPKMVTPMFEKENHGVLKDPRTTVVLDDGRHFIRTCKEKFDIITSDPIDPWVKGCAALNTVEYYEMCKAHLNPGGVMSLWIPLYESDSDTIKSVLATFFKVFPNGILWSNDIAGKGYDAVLFGQVEPTRIDVDQLQAKLDAPEHARVSQSLGEVGFNDAVDLLSTYAGRAADLQDWMKDAQINTDANLRLQYLAGLALNNYIGETLLNDIRKHYKFPDKVFVGSSAARLRDVLDHSAGSKETP